MSEPRYDSLFAIARAQAKINEALSAGNTFGEIGEAVAAAVTGWVRINGTGRDLKAPAPDWRRPTGPIGLDAPGPVRRPYSEVVHDWHLCDRARYTTWPEDADQIGEVKARQVSRRWPAREQFADIRGGGPSTPFFPLVDFFVVLLFDLDGDILMARRLDLTQMVDYVASDVGRGGAWNYKAAISVNMTDGTDLTDAAKTALRELRPNQHRPLRQR